MTIFIIKHITGSFLKIKDIGMTLSQSCKPFTGCFAKLAWIKDEDDDNDDGYLGDTKDPKQIEQLLVEVIDPFRDKKLEVEYDTDKECSILEVNLTEGRQKIDEDITDLVVANDG